MNLSSDERSPIIAYLESKGWPYSASGEEIRVSTCPFCGSTARSPFAINQTTGLIYCHACSWKGGFTTLKRTLGDVVSKADEIFADKAGVTLAEQVYAIPPPDLAAKLHENLLGQPKLLESLCAFRKLDLDTLRDFKIGFDAHMGIAYPFFEKGELTAVKYKRRSSSSSTGKIISRWVERSLDGSPIQGSRTKSTLFNVDSLTGNDRVFITEGEDDCMVLAEAGYANVVSVPNGSQSTKGSFLDPLESFREIFILFDNDRAGLLGADALANRLGRHRCRIIEIPGIEVPAGPWGPVSQAKDITDLARAEALHFLKPLIETTPIKTNDRVMHLTNYIDELRDEFFSGPRERGLTTGFPSLDNLIGGRRYGELVVVSGNTGSGKSTFCLNEAYQVAKIGEPVLLGCFEQPIPSVLKKMTQMVSGKTFHRLDHAPHRSMEASDFDYACKVLAELPIFFVNVFGEMGMKEYADCVEYSRRRLDCRTSILDHLHFMLRSQSQENERHEIDQAMLGLKQMTIELDINQWVVVHPAKRKGDDNPVLNLNDFRGSSFIAQVADVALIIWRDDETGQVMNGHYQAKVHSLKCRSEAGNKGSINLNFDHDAQTFMEADLLNLSPDKADPLDEFGSPPLM